jgi:hypothetical protein
MVDRNGDLCDSLDRVWKEFGKQTEAGKLLYDLYGVRFRPERFVKYPKIKVKTNEEKLREKEIAMVNNTRAKSSSMRNAVKKIDYPELNTNKYTYKYNKVDFIPKRKKENVIKQELEQIKDNMTRDATTVRVNKNRKAQIENLQDKFMFQERTVMPKGARLPGLKFSNNNNTEKESHSNYYTEQSEPIKIRFDNKREELQYLYTQITKEIDERYVHMEEMKQLGRNKDNQIMTEIRDRIDELKKIKRMIDEYDKTGK